jgi:hypothetical protein
MHVFCKYHAVRFAPSNKLSHASMNEFHARTHRVGALLKRVARYRCCMTLVT